MVIVSAAICDKGGKILLSRQYQNITKLQLEENIGNFPKLIDTNQQHTFVEDEYVRYVYQPIDQLYLILITKKNSNILEDEETIRLLYKILTELCPQGINESNILDNTIDILLAFDDVISFGYRESVSVSQVMTALEMESSEEKLHLMLLKARMNEAQEAAKKHQKEMERKRKLEVRAQQQSSSSQRGYGGGNAFNSSSESDVIQQAINKSAFAGSGSATEPEQTFPSQTAVSSTSLVTGGTTATKSSSQQAPKKGMQLTKKKTNQNQLNELIDGEK